MCDLKSYLCLRGIIPLSAVVISSNFHGADFTLPFLPWMPSHNMIKPSQIHVDFNIIFLNTILMIFFLMQCMLFPAVTLTVSKCTLGNQNIFDFKENGDRFLHLCQTELQKSEL